MLLIFVNIKIQTFLFHVSCSFCILACKIETCDAYFDVKSLHFYIYLFGFTYSGAFFQNVALYLGFLNLRFFIDIHWESTILPLIIILLYSTKTVDFVSK